MALGQYFVGKPVISVKEGKRVGTVKDLFVDSELRSVVGVYLGPEGLFNRRGLCVDRDNVVVYGADAVLIKQADAVTDSTPACDAAIWVRLGRVHALEATTPGGTRVATIDDVILDEQMHVLGFSLGRTHVSGPVAEKRAIAREAVLQIDMDTGITIDLSVAEAQSLSMA